MEVSLFLAKFLGFYFFVIGLFMILRKDFLKKAISNFFANPALVLCSGSISLLFGLWIVLIHPTFELNWHGLITLIGFFCVIKGIVRLFFFEKLEPIAKKLSHGKFFFFMGIVCVLIGLCLLYHGFYS